MARDSSRVSVGSIAGKPNIGEHCVPVCLTLYIHTQNERINVFLRSVYSYVLYVCYAYIEMTNAMAHAVLLRLSVAFWQEWSVRAKAELQGHKRGIIRGAHPSPAAPDSLCQGENVAGFARGSVGRRGGGLEGKDSIGSRILQSPTSFIREGGRGEGLPVGPAICMAWWKPREWGPTS